MSKVTKRKQSLKLFECRCLSNAMPHRVFLSETRANEFVANERTMRREAWSVTKHEIHLPLDSNSKQELRTVIDTMLNMQAKHNGIVCGESKRGSERLTGTEAT